MQTPYLGACNFWLKLIFFSADALEAAGIKVWVDEVGLKAGVEFFNKIGQAIVDAKVESSYF